MQITVYLLIFKKHVPSSSQGKKQRIAAIFQTCSMEPLEPCEDPAESHPIFRPEPRCTTSSPNSLLQMDPTMTSTSFLPTDATVLPIKSMNQEADIESPPTLSPDPDRSNS